MQEIQEIGLVVHDLIEGNSSYIDQYLGLYEELFPQYIHYLPLMRARAENAAEVSATEKWHQWLLQVHGEPVGLIGFLYNNKENTGLLLDFAIKPEARAIHVDGTRRFAKYCLDLAMQQLVCDAQARGRNAPLCLIAEVEYRPLVERYEQYGYTEFAVEYYEPPFTPAALEVHSSKKIFDRIEYQRMYVGAFAFPGHPIDLKDPQVIKKLLLSLLQDHYRLPADHWLVQKMIQQNTV